MAKFILGAIVTDVAGSIGGTTLRRGVRGHSMYNKQPKKISQSITNNVMRLKIGQVMRNWSLLDLENQTLWNNQAQNFTFPDKFGNQVKLTGRQLFIKLNSQMLVFGDEKPDVNLLNSEVQQPILLSVDAYLNIGGITLSFSQPLEYAVLAFALRQKPKSGGVKPHAHFKVDFIKQVEEEDTVNIYSDVIKCFPNIQAGQYYELHIYNINSSGFTSAVTAVKFLVS